MRKLRFHFTLLFVVLVSKTVLGQNITSLSPAKAKAGETIVIKGSGFDPVVANNTVWFDGVKATVTSAKIDSLEVTVPFGAPSHCIVYAINNTTGTMATSSNSPTPYFDMLFDGGRIISSNYTIQTYNANGGNAAGVFAGDFDNDGFVDVGFLGDITYAVPSDDSITIMKGNGTTAFTKLSSIFVGDNPKAVSSGDMDNDGDLDLIIALAGNNNVKILENDGTGMFTIASTIGSISGVYNFSAADFNEDGYIDFAMGSSNRTYKLINNQNMSFTSSIVSNTRADGIEVGDFNNDGHTDIIAGNNTSKNVALYLGNGTGGFTGNGTVSTTLSPYGLAVADFNKDGNIDYAVSSVNDNSIEIRLGNGSGGFTNAPSISASNARTMCVGDFNGDGNVDLVATRYSASTGFYIIEGKGDGTFLTPLQTSGNNLSLTFNSNAVADINNDGISDILSAHYNSGSFQVTYYKTPHVKYLTTSACDSYTSPFGNFTWTSSGMYKDFSKLPSTADTVVFVDLTINQPSTGIDVVTACDTYTWIDGLDYSANNNTATHTLTNAAGCDSIVTLNLTITHSTTRTDVITACDTYTWIDGLEYTSSNNTATYTLTNAAGCDSIVTLNLTITHSTTGTDVVTACDTYTWIDGLEYTSSNNTSTHTITNAAGCDSIVTLNLTVKKSTTGTDAVTACNSYTWIDGLEYTASNNTATHALTNAAGCDSIVTLNLTINYVDLTTNINNNIITSNASGAIYQWLDCDNGNTPIPEETNQSFVSGSSGNYAVQVTQSGCTLVSSCININTTGVSKADNANLITLYPNPTLGQLFITTPAQLIGQTLTITDAFGQVLKQVIVEKTTFSIDLSNQGNGIYFMQVSDGRDVLLKKIIKQ